MNDFQAAQQIRIDAMGLDLPSGNPIMISFTTGSPQLSYWLNQLGMRHRRWDVFSILTDPNSLKIIGESGLTSARYNITIFELDEAPFRDDLSRRGHVIHIPGESHAELPKLEIRFYLPRGDFETFTTDLRSTLRLEGISFDIDGLENSEDSSGQELSLRDSNSLRITTMVPFFGAPEPLNPLARSPRLPHRR